MNRGEILCAVDFSEASRAALHAAVDLARRLGRPLTLIHAVQLPAYPLPEGVLLPSGEEVARTFARADAALEIWRTEAVELGAGEVQLLSQQGAPWRVIVERAAEAGSAMIVIGTHGYTGIKHLLLGSVAERVVRTAQCPVLTVHAGQELAAIGVPAPA
jgi:nucleotide-binding universal stress UspA family protein